MLRLRACMRRELVFFALGTMEVCIFTPVIAALLSPIVQVVPLALTGALVVVVLAVHYLGRLSVRWRLRPWLRSGLLGLGMLVSGLIVVHRLLHAGTPVWDAAWLGDVFRELQREDLSSEALLFLLVLFVWWRGLALAQRRLGSSAIVRRFRVGLVMLAITTMLGGFVLPWPSYQFVFVFFFVSLLGIGLARAEEVAQQYGDARSPFNLGWVATLVGASLLTLLLAIGVASLMTGENLVRFLEPVLGPALELERALIAVLVYVLSMVMYVVSALLFSLFGELDLRELGRLLTPAGPGMLGQPEQPMESPVHLPSTRAIGTAAVLLFVLLLVALSIRRVRTRNVRREDEERESVWEGAQLRTGVRDLLLHGRRRLGDAANAWGQSVMGQLFSSLTIRRIYAQLGALAGERGYARAPHETPYEYLATLERAFPNNLEDVARITEAYVAVHYGEAPERPEDTSTIRAVWERIRAGVI